MFSPTVVHPFSPKLVQSDNGENPSSTAYFPLWNEQDQEGRQPGLSLVVASQQPAAIDREVLTQCGIRVVHRITAKDDFQAVNALSQDFLGDGLQTRIKRLVGPGNTLVIDDERETVVHAQVRPRQSLHGGGSA